MKEATGELNMTVVTVVAVAAVGAFFYAFVWPNIKNSIVNSVESNSNECIKECQANDRTGKVDCTAQCAGK
ncbi:MAG: hypothetical protein E7158_03240 [Firmicutes bacterium]|nr:hypothetical protein [Bacillota bacterium]